MYRNLALSFCLTLSLITYEQIKGQPCVDLFFSEYIEGSSFNKAVEIFNASADTIDLTSYNIKLYSNGDTTPTFSMGMSGNLLPTEVYIIAHPLATLFDSTIVDSLSTAVNFNGDDAIALYKDSILIDVIGEIGIATVWPVGSGSTQNYTLIRNDTVKQGQIDWLLGANEWDVYPIDTDSLGYHACYCNDTIITNIRNNEKDYIRVYPNPVNDILSIEVISTLLYPIRLDIYNIYGQKVYTQENNENLLTSNFDISLYNQPNGVYLIVIQISQEQYVKKILLNHER